MPLTEIRINPDRTKYCCYCHGQVFTDDPEWGMMDDFGKLVYFHLECFQMEEGLSVHETN